MIYYSKSVNENQVKKNPIGVFFILRESFGFRESLFLTPKEHIYYIKNNQLCQCFCSIILIKKLFKINNLVIIFLKKRVDF